MLQAFLKHFIKLILNLIVILIEKQTFSTIIKLIISEIFNKKLVKNL